MTTMQELGLIDFLNDSDDDPVYVNEGESAKVTATFKDLEDPPAALDKASLVTLVFTLLDDDGDVINSRDAQNCLDAGIGTVAVDGTLTLKLTGDDNPITNASTPDGGVEHHVLILQWTWQDLDLVTQTGRAVRRIRVRSLPYVS